MCIFSPSQSFQSNLPAGVRAARLTLQMRRGHVKALLEGCYSQTALSRFSLVRPWRSSAFPAVGFWTALGCSREQCVSDGWCGRKVEGGDEQPSEGISFFRALHTNHTPASERAQGICLTEIINSEPLGAFLVWAIERYKQFIMKLFLPANM